MANDSAPPKRGRGRPRREGADEQILAVARELLRQKGYRDFTVDAVAERTGIAKTTIYRRWPSKGVLVAAAIALMATVTREAPDSGSLEDDLTILVAESVAILSSELGPIAANLIAESHNDADLVDVVRNAIAPRRELIRHVLDRAGLQGDRELLVDLLTGAIWTRLLVTHAPLPHAREIVRMVLRGALDQDR